MRRLIISMVAFLIALPVGAVGGDYHLAQSGGTQVESEKPFVRQSRGERYSGAERRGEASPTIGEGGDSESIIGVFQRRIDALLKENAALKLQCGLTDDVGTQVGQQPVPVVDDDDRGTQVVIQPRPVQQQVQQQVQVAPPERRVAVVQQQPVQTQVVTTQRCQLPPLPLECRTVQSATQITFVNDSGQRITRAAPDTSRCDVAALERTRGQLAARSECGRQVQYLDVSIAQVQSSQRDAETLRAQESARQAALAKAEADRRAQEARDALARFEAKADRAANVVEETFETSMRTLSRIRVQCRRLITTGIVPALNSAARLVEQERITADNPAVVQRLPEIRKVLEEDMLRAEEAMTLVRERFNQLNQRLEAVTNEQQVDTILQQIAAELEGGAREIRNSCDQRRQEMLIEVRNINSASRQSAI